MGEEFGGWVFVRGVEGCGYAVLQVEESKGFREEEGVGLEGEEEEWTRDEVVMWMYGREMI